MERVHSCGFLRPCNDPRTGVVEAGSAQCVDEEMGAREWKNA